ncbi:MAG: MarR family winged helix-turn-helix transcriptional regulator [Lysobacterales bacterium]
MSDAFHLETFFPFLLSRLSNRVSAGISETYATRYNLSVSHWRLICLIGCYPKMSAGEVARRGELDKVAVSRSVSALIDRGLIERTFDQGDRRRSQLRLSQQGSAILDDIAPAATAYNSALLEALSEDDQQTLMRCVDKLWRQAQILESASQDR